MRNTLVLSLSARALLVALLCFIGFFLGKQDPDAGGYVDSFTNRAAYPKKYVHFVGAAALCMALFMFLPLAWAVGATIIAGLLYELGQGFISWLDWLAEWLGCAAVVLLALLASRTVLP